MTRTVLITGAAKGVGQAMALHLANPKTRLLLHYNTSEKEATQLAKKAEKKGAEVHLIQADLSNIPHREDLMDQVTEHTSALTVLINNVGVYLEKDLPEISPTQWQHVMDTTLNAVFHLTQRAVPLLQAGAPARVINLGDSGADRIVARSRATPYHAAKLGVNLLTRSFAAQLAPDNITVNMISPGFLENSVGDPGAPIPAGRLGNFKDINATLDFLLSKPAQYITGTNIMVSGGWNL